MAYAIPMIEPQTQKRAIAYCGISWTCLLFGPFPALYRGHILGFVGMTLMNIATLGLSLPVFIFVYNAWHYHSLLAQGFRPARHLGDTGRETSAEMSLRPAADPDAYFEPPARPPAQKIRLAMPELSERLIDDHGTGVVLPK
ncbi:MAG: hypothetical protein CMN55_13935 [Sneathiella sp.]|uniref:hypothetical protein n=1 Tax=Sneathiella sp. TaxID=1964365 RepID=UPI000C5923B2|nr:hypothetical protein [Sneathiella sp.]MAL80185.1 hypothetical protein [Sneathiella sp.]|tara:strand:+ start:269 stop:694 length:426 start_codon:yes stop_codon:yes gene_type:complete